MTPDPALPSIRSQLRGRSAVIGVFVVVSTLLLIGYYLFLRVDYAPVYTALKPADASAIVAELEAKGVPHRLGDGGTTILVPAAQIDSVRVTLAGSDIATKGSVGFELFNKSDMGLTDFAQKINYQRALQGELARSIMMIDGVETARVHLALPERSLFRGGQASPKAAVEVIAKLGRSLAPDRVAGIQNLVAAAVPDLPLSEVVVLDGTGRVISRAAASQPGSEVDEQTAVQQYFAARARTALENQLPGIHFALQVSALPTGARDDADKNMATRDFVLHLVVRSDVRLQPDDQEVARRAIAAAIALDERRGDTIAFETGIAVPASPVVSNSGFAMPAAGTPDDAAPPSASGDAFAWWWVAVLAAMAAAALLLRGLHRPRVDREHDALVERIRTQLGTSEAVDALR